MPWVRRLSGTFQALMVERSPPLFDANLSKLVYSCSPSTIPPAFFWPAPPVFSPSARLALLATHGVLGARVPLPPRPSACRPVAPASVCVPARSAPWLAQSRRIKPEVPRVRGRHGCPADEDCVETDQDLPLLLAVAHPHKVEAARKGPEASWI